MTNCQVSRDAVVVDHYLVASLTEERMACTVLPAHFVVAVAETAWLADLSCALV